jgi:hypothetical protein
MGDSLSRDPNPSGESAADSLDYIAHEPSVGSRLRRIDSTHALRPPFVDNPAGIGWDAANASILGLTFKLTLAKHW